jgi:hypothetical protein
MAKFIEWTEEQRVGFGEWLEGRPQFIRDLATKFPPDTLYRIKESGHRGHIVEYNENGTVTIAVSGEFNAVIFDRNVFGVNPENIEECELPTEDERVGTMLTEKSDIDEFVYAVWFDLN